MPRQHGLEGVGGPNVPVDYVSPLDAVESSYVGRRRAALPVAAPRAAAVPVAVAATHARTVLLEDRPPVQVLTEPVHEPIHEPVREPVSQPVRELDRELDTVTIERVLNSLEPVDHTTSFEHEPTTRLPMLRAEPPTPGGKRRAVKHAGGRGPLFKGFLSAPVLMGIAALAVSVGGVVTVDGAQPTSGSSAREVTHAASALGGTSGSGKVSARKNDVSRDRDRDAQADAAGDGAAPGRCRRPRQRCARPPSPSWPRRPRCRPRSSPRISGATRSSRST